ncbi:hypothetical protein QJS10_CPA07g00258 [Acorus calamus]|uniref:Uncharacterized protein n=1 Tax=Acorus calamus TaxID=4465 RepID=A0AAV9EG31_ACOCL|nr:hypothetical protein QJS10_CPA07g00258 [Acorus calamus]
MEERQQNDHLGRGIASRIPHANFPETKFVAYRELSTAQHHKHFLVPSLFHQRAMLGLFQPSSVVSTLPTRCMTTTGESDVSINDGISDSAANPGTVPLKFKRLDKTARNIMKILDKEAVDKVQTGREFPELRPGYIVQLKVEVPENKRRVSVVKGIVIAMRNAGLNSTFRIRRMVAGVGVESLFHLYSPNIKEMRVLEKKRVRRAKLYYLRERMNALNK